MFTRDRLPPAALTVLAALFLAGPAKSETPNIGKPISANEFAAWNITILPDGSGLPAGSGTASVGATIYDEKCSACHGADGIGGIVGGLVGKPPLKGPGSPKTVANFWGHATSVFDYTRRAMPFTAPMSLTNNEVYALTAYIFARNKIIGNDEVMNAQTLPKVKMPNADNFIIRFPDRMPAP